MQSGPRPPLVLASASPRRLDLLRQIGIEPDRIVSTDIVESPKRGELPADHARRMARAKASAAGVTELGAIVLAADTVVALGRRILGKATDEAEAGRMLRALSGRAHRVMTAIVTIGPDGRERERLVDTRVVFKRLSESEIHGYLAAGEWRGKAGAYGIQGMAALFVRRLNGSYSNVVGLPLAETAALLAAQGYPIWRPA